MLDEQRWATRRIDAMPHVEPTRARRLSFPSNVKVYCKSLDLRFLDKDEEKAFQQSLEPDLLRWMLLGCVLVCVCTIFNSAATFAPEFLDPASSHVHHDFGDFSDVRNRVFFGQLLMWTLIPACLGCLVALRIFWSFFLKWNWEAVVTGTVCYGSVVVVMGQLFHMTTVFGGDSGIWKSDVACSAEAWVLLGLNSMTTAACFFLPLRSIVSWLVPVLGVMTYSVMKATFETEKQPSQILVKILLMLALSYLAWHGSARNEEHLRTEWRAIGEVRKASEQIVEQQVFIQQKTRDIHEKEKKIQVTTELVCSLQTVAHALCDTMVHLCSDLRVRDSNSASTFFEREIEGIPFTDLLSSEDQARFALSASRASSSNIPVCLPVTVHKQFSTSECHLVLVHRGVTELCYLVGIRTERDNPVQLAAAPASFTQLPSESAATGDLCRGPTGVHPSALAVVPAQVPVFTSVLPRGGKPFGAIDEDLESDFSFTTCLHVGRPRPPKFTNSRVRARTIRMILKRWNVPRDCDSCCQYHTVLDSIDEAVECLRQQKCDPLWSTYGEQCPRCACMNQALKCVVCGFAPDSVQKSGGSSASRKVVVPGVPESVGGGGGSGFALP